MKAAALRNAPPISIAILAILFGEQRYINKFIFSICRKNLLVFEILFQRHAASYDSGDFFIVRDVASGVGGEVPFNHLSRNPADAGGEAGQSSAIYDRFHNFFARHGVKRVMLFLK